MYYVVLSLIQESSQLRRRQFNSFEKVEQELDSPFVFTPSTPREDQGVHHPKPPPNLSSTTVSNIQPTIC